MPFSFTGEEFARIGDSARRLVEQSESQEAQMGVLLAGAEADVNAALYALTRPRPLTRASMDELAAALRAQLIRTRDNAATARQLCLGARQSRLTASRLLAALKGAADHGKLARRVERQAVLVVDDYEDTRELLSTLLNSAGFIVRTASNGLEAILAAYEMKPAVIVMDVKMPVLDGLETARLIKESDTLRAARVIAYTAKPALGEGLAGTLFAAVLPKPTAPEVIIATVRQWAEAPA